MKKFLRALGILILINVIIAITVFMILKIKDDTLAEKNKDIDRQNAKVESEYVCDNATQKLKTIIEKIEDSIDAKIEVADIGSLDCIDIYFVTKQDNNYKFIVKETIDGRETFKISEDNENDAKYIVPLDKIGMDNCIYTEISNYSIDKKGNITYLNSI